jgi:hypothetical protein
VPVGPGEHPRLFFRRHDIPELRRRAETPEGKLIVARLRHLLDGKNGETMTTVFNPAKAEYPEGEERAQARAAAQTPGVFTHSHAAGYGFLYHLTGDRKYAEFGKQCFIKGMDEKVRDRDSRYSLDDTGALRVGPTLAMYAIGYDLCYDGWDPEFRKHVCATLLHLNPRERITVESLARGRAHHPACNHWGGQISGPPMLALAMMGDPEADQARVQQILEWGRHSTLRQLTTGIGDYGFFGGGIGPGVITTDTAFIPLLQAWKVAAGLDYHTPRPVGEWLTMRFAFACVPRASGGKPLHPVRGVYGGNYFRRNNMSGSGTWCQGFGALSDRHKPAMLWLYNRSFRDSDFAAGQPWDTVNPYPHRCILALVNWPFGIKEENPGKVLPKAYLDKYWSLAEFRSGWTGPNDVLVSALTHTSGGHYLCRPDIRVIHGGKVHKLPFRLCARALKLDRAEHGGVVHTEKGSLAVDFSGASGAEVLIACTDPAYRNWRLGRVKPKQPTLDSAAGLERAERLEIEGLDLGLPKKAEKPKPRKLNKLPAYVHQLLLEEHLLVIMGFGGEIAPRLDGRTVTIGNQKLVCNGAEISLAR